MFTELDPFTRVFLIIFVILTSVFVILAFAQWLINFSRELSYLNAEIKRTHGRERAYWIRERKRLWLSILPFIKY